MLPCCVLAVLTDLATYLPSPALICRVKNKSIIKFIGDELFTKFFFKARTLIKPVF